MREIIFCHPANLEGVYISQSHDISFMGKVFMSYAISDLMREGVIYFINFLMDREGVNIHHNISDGV